MRFLLLFCLTSFAISMPVSASETLVKNLETGHWAWPEGENTCAENPQQIELSDNHKTMTITWAHTNDPAIYDILYFNDKSSFTSLIRDEDRLTDAGDRVKWVLKIKDDNHFCWRRTDWPSYACTPNQIRCEVGS